MRIDHETRHHTSRRSRPRARHREGDRAIVHRAHPERPPRLLKITTIDLGRTLPSLRDKQEPFYADPGKGRNVMQPASKPLVALPDGNFHLEAMDSHGGLIASSEDLTRFLAAYKISGEPRKAGNSAGYHFGSLPGTFTLRL